MPPSRILLSWALALAPAVATVTTPAIARAEAPAPPTATTPAPVTTPPVPTAPPTPVDDEKAKPQATPDDNPKPAEVPATASSLPPAPSGTPAERERWLRARLDEILARPGLGAARVGVAVVDVDSGRMLYAHNDATQLNPASNVKLFTTAAALALLGPEFRWKTVLLADAVKSGVVEGNLYLKGFGDPSLQSEDLWKLTAELATQGIKRVTGDLVVDDSYFDAQRVGPGFEQKQEDFAFRAPNGAVSLDYNACSILVLPGKPGQAARVVVEPPSPYLVVKNGATTILHGHGDIAVASRETDDGHTIIEVSGSIRAGDGGHLERRRIAHPDLFAGWSLRELLVRRGIKVAGGVRPGAAPPGLRQLVGHYSPPLGVLVRDVNKHSNNFMAEQLVKTLGAETGGRPGTWQKGVDAVMRFLETLGIAREKYKLTNGSGLYDSNRFTASEVVALLRAVYKDFRYASDFVGSLPVSGADGTIGHRMEGALTERYVRAKTGTLAGVSCLSGYAGAPGHLPLAFAILMNDLAETATPDARRAQDAIAEALVTFLASK